MAATRPIGDGRADTRTVLQLAAYFAELKATAREFIDRFDASSRGYFTPSEDEQVRQLLVSYWHARNALLELVLQHRREAIAQADDDPAGFLTTFGAALVLIDAARFLRDNLHTRPVVRAKLNEPEPHFGIPAGCYDRIQKSLTRPVHAWHLYHALQYFDQNQQPLHDAVRGDAELQAVLKLVHSLRDALGVSVSRLAVARVRSRARSLRTRVRRVLFQRALYGLQKAVSSLMAEVSVQPGHEPALPLPVVRDLEQLLLPGDVLITRKEHAVTNYFLPGFWPHAAFFVGDTTSLLSPPLSGQSTIAQHAHDIAQADPDQPRRVIESMKDGVLIRSLANPLRCDAIAALRPLATPAAIDNAIARGFFHVGKGYDFDFDFSRSDRLVCTEVVYRSFDGIEGTRFQLTRRAGRPTLAAEDLLRMGLCLDGFRVLAAFVPGCGPELQTGASAEQLIRDTVGGT